MKKALITGITGQDGSYLAELLLSKGYEVHGVVLRSEIEDPIRSLSRLSGVINKITLHAGSIEAFPSLINIIGKVKPDECYHLAASSFVSYSFDDEFSTFNVNINGTHNILSALKNSSPDCKFYFAGSSEMFGRASVSPQNETTPFNPRSAYGITKVTGFYLTSNYRENYGMFASNGILYNHESPRRGYEYVTRKISYGAAQIKLGLKKDLHLGNLDAERDWGYAADYVNAMWLMLQQEKPQDYVIATGEAHTIREFCEIAFSRVGLNYQDHIAFDQQFYRPVEVVPLVGDASRARNGLGWKPTISFRDLVEMMVDADLSNLTSKQGNSLTRTGK
ncbi:MAG TPA: GDP-mannose 4,6-dehydratase [Longilinea sp.]|nr:GDP-mannose 4,6-dehydratase [Longilinea sp.]